jgi:KipI family sensor histidine kinase inhibitor
LKKLSNWDFLDKQKVSVSEAAGSLSAAGQAPALTEPLERGFPRISSWGESALSVEFGTAISPALNDRVSALAANLAARPIAGIIETIPAYASLLVCFDLRQIHARRLSAQLKKRLGQNIFSAAAKKRFFIPVCYEAEFAADMADVASHTALSAEEIITRHTAPLYRIYMLGFLPGFPYLGGLDTTLETPRRSVPRTVVPRGAVGIGGSQTGIYPMESPGGWQLIGRTPLRVYDSARAEPVLYQAGDFISFFAITRDEYNDIEKQVEEGVYEVKCEPVTAASLNAKREGSADAAELAKRRPTGPGILEGRR